MELFVGSGNREHVIKLGLRSPYKYDMHVKYKAIFQLQEVIKISGKLYLLQHYLIYL